MSKKIYLLTVSLVSLLLIMKAGIVLSQETASTETQEAISTEPQETSSAEPQETSSAEPQETSSAEPEETSSAEPEETSSAEPEEVSSAEPQSIHQRASICWNDFEVTFPDEPLSCQDVCNRCHTDATVVPGQSGNPEAVTTDKVYPEVPSDEVSWDTIGLLQESCKDCHSDKIDPDTNHAIFVEHEVNYSDNFKETELKLFDGHVLCTTCHSPHSGNVALLRIPNQGSRLCIDCHTT